MTRTSACQGGRTLKRKFSTDCRCNCDFRWNNVFLKKNSKRPPALGLALASLPLALRQRLAEQLLELAVLRFAVPADLLGAGRRRLQPDVPGLAERSVFSLQLQQGITHKGLQL